MSKEVFRMTQNCIPVKGINQSVICDLHRNEYSVIPNDLFNILTLHEGKTEKEIKKSYENQFDEAIDEYFDFLINKEYVFLTNTPEWFPKMSLEWYYPFEISNAILDRDLESKYNIFEALQQLDGFCCKHVELRFYHTISLDEVEKIISYLNKAESITSSVSFLFPNIISKKTEDYQNILKNNPRISSFIINSSNHNKFIQPVREKVGFIIYTQQKMLNEKCCGVINSSYFIANIKNFTESLKHNSCLNRKISIDVNGDIKNCPSLQRSFGNIKDTTLQEALEHKDFKKYWNITKDEIEVCKDCEFRYVCTDCRAYVESPENDYSKPLKCGYDPYTNKWEEWSTNPLKQKAIERYGMQDFAKDND